MRNNKTLTYLHNIRMAGFPIGLGLTSVLVGGTLNRVMIVELEMPASLVGFFFALPLLVSPARIWLGYRSDSHPLLGLRREPYIVAGSLIAALGVSGIAFSTLNLSSTLAMIGVTLFAFIAYGLGKNLSSNTFEALLADKFEGEARPRAVTFFKVAMFLGIIGGAIGLGKMLDPFSVEKFISIVVGVVIVAFFLSTFASLWQEPRTEEMREASEEAGAVSFVETFKIMVWADPQVRLFFIFVMLTVVGTLAQDVLLEPYGALVLNMSVGETTILTAIWGAGTVLSMMIAGAWMIKKFGYAPVLRAGLLLGIIVFAGIITAGAIENISLFLGLVFALGICTGLSAAGMLTAVIEFTTAARAGLLMGVWGVAHELGQAFGSLMSGTIVDIGRALTNDNALIAYSTVFALEAILLALALVLEKKIDLSQSKIMAER